MGESCDNRAVGRSRTRPPGAAACSQHACHEGHVYSKAQYIAAVTQAIKVDSYGIADHTVRVYGDTGIVAGRWTGKMTIDGKDASGAFRYTDTFVKRQGRWQVVASQDTRIPKQGS